MQRILLSIVFFSVAFLLVECLILSPIEQPIFESRVKAAETILFGRFDWGVPINDNDNLNEVYSTKQNTFEFSVYCTIKRNGQPDNVPRLIHVVIENNDTEIDMKKNTWFIIFPKLTHLKDTWIIQNRSEEVFDLEDDIELRIFEQFCFLKPKLPFGFPSSGLLNRCPKPSLEYCLKNGTRIHHDELLELNTFLRSTTTRKPRPTLSKPVVKRKRFIEPIW